MSGYSCRDRMCGALDCDRCHPGNPYGQLCAHCDHDYDECECDEFEAVDDYDEDEDDYYDERDDWEADRIADEYDERAYGAYDEC